jgi:SLT domain-containing protein
VGTAASLAVSVFPTAKDFGPILQKQVVPAATEVGAKTGRSFSDAFSEQAARAGMGAGSAIGNSARTAQLAIEQAAAKVVAAHAREEDAAGRVRIAEQRLAEARSKYAADSSQVVAAEERLAAAERNVALTADRSTLATSELSVSRKNAAAAATASATATDAESASLGRVRALAAETSGTVGGLTAQYGKLGALVGVALAIDLGVKGVQAAGAFQQSQERLVTTAGELQSNLAMVSSGVLSMAGQVGISAQDLSKGMYTIESAGYHGADGLKVMRAAAQGAKEENADLSTVSNALTSALRDYHLPASDAALVTSRLVAAVSDGKTTFQDLTGAMSAVLPIASATHVNMSEVLGDLSSMTLHGESADQSAQNLANAIRSLANPSLAATKELAALGINSADLSKNLGKAGIAGSMQQVVDAILHHMGPAGTTLFNAFNQSKQAASDANTMFAALPPKLHAIASQMLDGKLSMHEWTQGLKTIDPVQANLLKQWLTSEKRATGFNDALKNGGNASQTFTQALAKATGGSTALNVALMLTGENAAKTQQNIRDISAASTEAGGNVHGWAEIQNTLNQRLAEVRAGIGSWVISIGQKLIPVLTSMIIGLQGAVAWLVQNRVWIGLVATVIGTLVGPIVAVRLAIMAWNAVRAVILNIRVAIWLLNAAIAANPVVALTLAIAALVAGVVYAYFHFTAFRRIVDDIGRFFRAVFLVVLHAVMDAVHWLAEHWKIFAIALAVIFAPITICIGLFVLIISHIHEIGAAFVWLYQHSIQPMVSAIVIGARAVAEAFMWLWRTILKPILSVLADIFLITAKVILALVIAPIVIAVRSLGAVFEWLAPKVVAAWNIMGNIARAVYQAAIAPIVAGIVFGYRLVMAALDVLATWFAKIWNAIGDAIRRVYDAVLAVIWARLQNDWRIVQAALGILAAKWHDLWSVIAAAAKWVYDNILLPIWQRLQNDWRILQAALSFLYNNVVRPIWTGLGNLIRDIYHGVIEPIWARFKLALADLQEAFKKGVGLIGSIWEGLKKAFGTPIEFVIKTILNDGIIKGINWILGAVGLSIPLIPDPHLPTFERGGIVPGSGPVDSVHALVTPGEGILTPATVRGLGGAPAIHALNSLFGGGGNGPTATRSGLPGFGLGGFVGDLLGGIGSAASSAWSAVKNVALGGLRAAASTFFDSVIKPLISSIPGGQSSEPVKMLAGLANKIESDILSFLGAKDAAANASGAAIGGTIPTGARLNIITNALAADGIPQSDWAQWEAGLNTLITRESGWNPNAVNLTDSNAQAGHPSTGLGQTIIGTFEAYRNKAFPDSMTNPVANVAAVINYIQSRYHGISHVQQANANLPPKGYDGGGYIPPGVSVIANWTRRPEPVFTGSQWDVMRANLSQPKTSGTHQYFITSHDPSSVAHEIERRETAHMRARL